MRWRRFTVTVPHEASEAVSAILQELCGGLSIVSTEALTAHQAYVAENVSPEAVQTQLYDRLQSIPDELATPEQITVEADWVQEEDWAEAWKQHYQPIRVSERVVVVPSWRPWPDPDSATVAHPDDIVIRMDPGMAFGTGSHSTTRLCMIALERHMAPGARLIDFGCGSGILSITACKLGAEQVLAVDNDPVCVDVAGANLTVNSVAECCEVRLADSLEQIDRRGEWDVVVANIGPDIVAAAAGSAAKLLKPEGHYILSGFTERSENDIAAALAEVGMAVVDQLQEAEWRCWVASAISPQVRPPIVGEVER
ncbi:MAG: 50S ribosomal protein L11 methyltransferase [candidate division WS1 bacterium]|nr:50S ribosomal protein L11 methyltransferase [candidate division WS1 bacterium]